MSLRRLNRIVHRYGTKAFRSRWDNLLAKSFAKKLAKSRSLVDKVDVATGKGVFRSNQRRSEILSLLSMIQEISPRVICEIGCDTGGTLALFAQCAQADGMIISMDIRHTSGVSIGLESLVTPTQKMVSIAGDSHDTKVFDQLRETLNGQPIDFLFIDGDHSFHGVYQDFLMYTPFLREGGLLAFHDIVEPRESSDSTNPDRAYVGEVPEFFRDYIEPHFNCQRLINDPQQSGYGIGVLQWPNEATAKSLLAKVQQLVTSRNR